MIDTDFEHLMVAWEQQPEVMLPLAGFEKVVGLTPRVEVYGQPYWDDQQQHAVVPKGYLGMNRHARKALERKLTKIGRKAHAKAAMGSEVCR